MSRIGRLPVAIPAGVTVTVDKQKVTVNGGLGTLTREVDKNIKVTVEGAEVVFTRPNDLPENKAKHGLYRQLVANMVEGVSKGFSKTLIINGVGYKAVQAGEKVNMALGLSHPVELVPSEGIKLQVKSNTELIVSGIDKEKVGQYAAKIRDIRPVEPYHAYGIRYSDEVVIRKAGKTAKK